MGRVAAILLAAGLSRRMGARNKLLMSVAGEPMVRHLAQTYLSILTTPLTVVTGHDSDRRMMRLVKRLKALREKLKMTPEQANNIRFPCC
ncbi:NTP transferase domain-containing protein [Ruegeria pomeroyi]|nr:NTP transferase domain-containing protein [Ruegeria pomeroyi]